MAKITVAALKKALDEHLQNDPELKEEILDGLNKKEREQFVARRQGKQVEFTQYKTRKPPSGGAHGIVIGDPHAIPGQDNRRFEWAGRMVHDLEPDFVVLIGDLYDFPSLLGFDKKGRGSKSFEGRRYYRDIEAGRDALDRLEYFFDGWSGDMFITLGNHEERIARVLEFDPRLEGLLGYEDLGLDKWTVVKPGERILIHGVEFKHFHQRTQGFGGKYPAMQMLVNRKVSSVQGHTHRRDFVQFERIHCLDVGCYFDYQHDWLPQADQRQYWRGIVELRDVRDGTFNPHFWGIEEIERRYGK